MGQEVKEEEVSLFDDDGGQPDVTQAAEAQPQQEAAPEFEVPEKFRDKSLEDVIKSYVNLEKEYGNKSNEVGELRKWADTLLQAQNSPKPEPQAQTKEDINDYVGFEDFIDDPNDAVTRALQSNPTIKKLEQSLAQQQLEASRQALLKVHPDADSVVASPEFQSWMMEAPGRQAILTQAHQNMNVDVAVDMLNLYKATRQAANEEATTERGAKAKADLAKASVESGGAPASTKKIYKRSELIELKVRDPRRYEGMREEIHRAYAEGRVK